MSGYHSSNCIQKYHYNSTILKDDEVFKYVAWASVYPVTLNVNILYAGK